MAARARSGIIIAGGGTAGHVLPALSIAAALVERGHDPATIHFIGSARGQEATLVPAAGYGITLLAGRGIQRRLAIENVGAVVGLVRAFFGGMAEVRRRRPAVCLTVGGYASVAGAVSSVLQRIPLVVSEQNALASAANRLVGRFARYCAVPFAGTDLPHAVVCGNPVRDEILARGMDRRMEEARAQLGVQAEQKLVFVFAGSLGSRRINEAVLGLVDRWADRSDVVIRHALGTRDWEALAPAASGGPGLRYEPMPYEQDVPTALAAADLVISRSGGTTVAELAVIGVGSILVPLPIAPRDHQRFNAAPLVDAGAAVMVLDDELDVDRLEAELSALLEGDRSARMGAAARTLGRPGAASDIAELVDRAADRSTEGS